MIAMAAGLSGVLILIICLIICICVKNRNQRKAITPLNVVIKLNYYHYYTKLKYF